MILSACELKSTLANLLAVDSFLRPVQATDLGDARSQVNLFAPLEEIGVRTGSFVQPPCSVLDLVRSSIFRRPTKPAADQFKCSNY